MEKWINDNAETDQWPDCYIGGETHVLMAGAAATVLDAVAEIQAYAKEAGFVIGASDD